MGGDGQDVELVVDDETLLTRGQREDESEERKDRDEVAAAGNQWPLMMV